MEPQFYWELIQRDGTVIEIPPDAVEMVKKRWDAGQPIHTKYSGSIPAHQIVAFRPTEKLASHQPLLEGAAQAFNTPLLESYPSGEQYIVSKWVKKMVTQNKWDKYYSPSGYKKLNDLNGMVVVAFRLPVHQINYDNVQPCTKDEIEQLKRY